MMEKLRKLRRLEINRLPEVIDRSHWLQRTLLSQPNSDFATSNRQREEWSSRKMKMLGDNGHNNHDQLKTVMKGALLTYLLHW